MVRLLFSVIAFLAISSGSASPFDGENANDVETVKKVEAVKVENVNLVKSRDLASQFTQAPTRKVGPPTPKPFSPTRPPSVRGTASPNASGPVNKCIFLVDKTVFDCGEPITVRFNYAYRGAIGPLQYPTFKDRIAIYPCYVNTYTRHAEVWQWGCGPPPAIPETCVLPRSRGFITFNGVPRYNGARSDWPLAPFTKPNGQVNRCFKVVILRTENSPYYPYCEVKFTVKENSKTGCAIRDSSPSDP